MSKKLPVVSGKQTVQTLLKLGFTARLGKGDHLVLQKKPYSTFCSPTQNTQKRDIK